MTVRKKEESDDGVIFFAGLDVDHLKDEIFGELKEYLGGYPTVGHISYGKYSDSEFKDAFPDYEDIRGKTIVFIECLKSSETTMRLLQHCWAAKTQYGAKRIIVVATFLHYRRQDHPEKLHEIHRNKWLIHQMKTNGVDELIVATPHSKQTQVNCLDEGIVFREVNFAQAFALACDPLLPEDGKRKRVKLLAPDEGSIARAIELARFLDVDVLFNIKKRGTNNQIVIPDNVDEAKIREIIALHNYDRLYFLKPELIEGAIVIMFDDEVTTGSTANKQGKLCKMHGSTKVMFFATHPVCSNEWKEILMDEMPFHVLGFTETIFRGKENRTNGKVLDVPTTGPIVAVILRALRNLCE
jgi:phosphoribosylpyrophosphate synthetase